MVNTVDMNRCCHLWHLSGSTLFAQAYLFEYFGYILYLCLFEMLDWFCCYLYVCALVFTRVLLSMQTEQMTNRYLLGKKG